jgi:hypothetical protein
MQGHTVAAAAAAAFSPVLFVFLTIDGVKVVRTLFHRSILSQVETRLKGYSSFTASFTRSIRIRLKTPLFT